MDKNHSASHTFRRKLLLCPIVISAIFVVLLRQPAAPVYALPAGYQEYYVLGNETQLLLMFREIQGLSNLSSMSSVVTVVATADHQIVYYDHWEDGYEPDILAPVQSTTEVYGEVGSIVNALNAGDIITLNSDGSGAGVHDVVPMPRGTDLRYDGGDRLLSIGGPIDVVRSLWPSEDIFVGGAWAIYPVGAWSTGYSYIVPVGQDLYVDNQADQYFPDFQHVWLEIQALENNTTVHIDNGTESISIRLDRGQTYSSMGYRDAIQENVPGIAIRAGTTLLANKSIQGGLVTGREANQSRFYTLVPDADWGTEYVAPIPRTNDANKAEVYLYNPDLESITVTAHDEDTPPDGIAFVLNGTTTRAYRDRLAVGRYVPRLSALRLYSSGPLWAMASADTGQAGYDWGFSFVPTRFAGREYYVSWAPGRDGTGAANASPVWVAPLNDNVHFSVDYGQPTIDGIPDESFVLDALQMRRVHDPDGDNTGMHLQADKPFVAIWGEDPAAANNEQGMDMGYPVLPLDGAWQDRVITLYKTPKVQTLATGVETVTFTLRAEAGQYTISGIALTDTLPLPWSYVTGSTQIVFPDGTSETIEPETNEQTLHWPLDKSLQAHQSLTLTFSARVANTEPRGETHHDDMENVSLDEESEWSSPLTQGEAGCGRDCVAHRASTRYGYADDVEILDTVTAFTNIAHATAIHRGRRFGSTDQATVLLSSLHVSQKVDKLRATAGDHLTYSLSYTNSNQSSSVTGIIVRQVLAANTTFVSAAPGHTYTPAAHTITWGQPQALTLPPGGSATLMATVSVNAWTRNGQVLTSQSYVESDQTPEVASNPAETLVQAPEIALIKKGPERTAPGQIITYTVAYSNTGPITATGVLITDPIPTFTTYQANSIALDTGSGYVALSDARDGDAGEFTGTAIAVRPGRTSNHTAGQIGPGESGRIRFAVRVGPTVPVGRDIANYATLIRDYARPQNSALLLTIVSDLTLDKRANLDVVNPGQLLSYTLTVGGVGSQAPSQVYVQDAIPPYTTYVSGTASVPPTFDLAYSLDFGQSWQNTPPGDPDQVTHLRWYVPSIGTGVRIPLSYAVQLQEPLPAADIVICNQARAWSTGTPQLNSDQVCVQTLDLHLDVAYEGPPVVPGQPITLTLAYGNDGSTTAKEVNLTSIVPEYTLFDADKSGPGWACSAGTAAGTPCSLAVGDLPTASSGTITFTVILTDSMPAGVDSIASNANISSRYGLTVSGTRSIPIIADAELVVFKSNGVSTFEPGSILTYSISLRNAGNQGASGIFLTDTLPSYTTFVSGSASHSGVYVPSQRQIVWALAPALDGNSETSRTLQIRVDSSLPDGVAAITNTVRVSDDGGNGDTPAGNVARDVDTLDFRPALRIAKYGPARAQVGDTVVFSFTVSTVSFTPTGARTRAIGDGSPIRDLIISDSIASPVRYVTGDDGDRLLEIGEVWIYTAPYTIRETDRGLLVNIGTATGKDINGDTVTASSTHRTVVGNQTLYLPLIVENS